MYGIEVVIKKTGSTSGKSTSVLSDFNWPHKGFMVCPDGYLAYRYESTKEACSTCGGKALFKCHCKFFWAAPGSLIHAQLEGLLRFVVSLEAGILVVYYMRRYQW